MIVITIVIPVMIMVMIAVMIVVVVPVFALANFKIGAAATIDPELVAVHAPRLTFDAGGITVLAHEASAASGIDRAGVAVHVVGGAVNDAGAVASTLVPVIATVDLEFRAAATIHPQLVAPDAKGLSLYAGRVTMLAIDGDSAVRADITSVIAHVIGVTADDIALRKSRQSTENEKGCP